MQCLLGSRRAPVTKASTTERIAHSEFPGTSDVDFQLPGTPLSWAVHHNRPHIVRTLLKHGADPNLVPNGLVLSPLLTAAYYHHDDCLRIMVEHLERGGTVKTTEGKTDPRFVVTYGPLIREAVNAADKFSMILRNGSKYLDRLHSTLGLLQEKTRYVNFQNSFQGNMLYSAVAQAHDLVVEYMLRNGWCAETLNYPCGDAQRTAVIEAVRWNRRPLFRMLLEQGADIHAMAVNPFQLDLRTWSVLHVFAHEGQNEDVSLVEALVELGVPVDGLWETTQEEDTEAPPCSEVTELSIHDQGNQVFPCETPLAVAIRHNAFHLASVLVSKGANPNFLSLSAGLFQSTHQLTILGHIIISNARYSSARLKYLLHFNPSETDFIVEPSRQLSALHRVVMTYQNVSRVDGGAVQKEEFDMETYLDIMYDLLLRWPQSRDLNAPCGIRGNTALHLAVAAGNIGAVESLVNAGADELIVNEDGETALGGQSKQYERISQFLRDFRKE